MIVLKLISIGVVCVVVFMISSLIIDGILYGSEGCPPVEANYILFDRFVAFYNINSDKWKLENHRVSYKKNTMVNRFGCTYPSTIDTYFYFNYRDQIKYRRWLSNLEELKLKQKHLKEYQEVLECVKKDLEEFNRKNDEMMKSETEKYAKAIDDMLRIPDDGYQFKSNVAKIQRYLWEHEME